jgi:hypothetical protein
MLLFSSTATWANYIGDLVYCDQDGDGMFEPLDGSQPLFLGDSFGAIQLMGFEDKNGNGSSLL